MKPLFLSLFIASMIIGCQPQDHQSPSDKVDNAEVTLTFSEFNWDKVAKTSVAEFTSIELPEGMKVVGKSIEETEQFSRFLPSATVTLYDGKTAHTETGDLTYFDIGMIEAEQTFDKARFDSDIHQYMQSLDAVEIFNGVVPPDIIKALKATNTTTSYDYMTGDTTQSKLRLYALNHEDGTQSFYQIVSDDKHGQLGILEVASSEEVVPITEPHASEAHINPSTTPSTDSLKVNSPSPANHTEENASLTNKNERSIPTASELKNQLDTSGKAIININFDSGYSSIAKDDQPIIEQIYHLLQDNPDIKLTIEGHTDNVGGANSNRRLSQRRANRVKHLLVQRGISSKRLKSKGYGESKPMVDNNSADNRAKNRRIELTKF